MTLGTTIIESFPGETKIKLTAVLDTGSNSASIVLPVKVTEVNKDILRKYPHSKRVGNYLLGKTLGEGSFAKVKEALHTITGQKVAVKIIDKKKVKTDPYVRKNLKREAKLLQMMRHPNTIKLHETMETENSYYLVTELCEGGEMMDRICSKKRLDEKEVRRYLRQILSATQYLHTAGVLHRDLKIENLMFDHIHNVKLIDFGLSNLVKVATSGDGSSSMQELLLTQCGSPAYAAPELLAHKKYGAAVDVWSIGVNMYAMLTGNLPFTVDPFHVKALLNKMLNGDMNPLPDSLSLGGRDLLKKLLNPDPNYRIKVCEAMRHPWITTGVCGPISIVPYPNRIRTDQLHEGILRHMSQKHNFKMGDVIRTVVANTPSSSNATYHLLEKKLAQYQSDMRVAGKIAAVQTRPSDNKADRRDRRIFTRRPNPSKADVTVGEVIELLPLNKTKEMQGANEAMSSLSPVPARSPGMDSRTENPQSPRRHVLRFTHRQQQNNERNMEGKNNDIKEIVGVSTDMFDATKMRRGNKHTSRHNTKSEYTTEKECPLMKVTIHRRRITQEENMSSSATPTETASFMPCVSTELPEVIRKNRNKKAPCTKYELAKMTPLHVSSSEDLREQTSSNVIITSIDKGNKCAKTNTFPSKRWQFRRYDPKGLYTSSKSSADDACEPRHNNIYLIDRNPNAASHKQNEYLISPPSPKQKYSGTDKTNMYCEKVSPSENKLYIQGFKRSKVSAKLTPTDIMTVAPDKP